mmetsp:Transcript_37092/g.91663  ORF Transcript_37092/g.91663 Transcript_37092/m.91663 type:complete len:300 (-) Transcript_37092:1218-2117(-)
MERKNCNRSGSSIRRCSGSSGQVLCQIVAPGEWRVRALVTGSPCSALSSHSLFLLLLLLVLVMMIMLFQVLALSCIAVFSAPLSSGAGVCVTECVCFLLHLLHHLPHQHIELLGARRHRLVHLPHQLPSQRAAAAVQVPPQQLHLRLLDLRVGGRGAGLQHHAVGAQELGHVVALVRDEQQVARQPAGDGRPEVVVGRRDVAQARGDQSQARAEPVEELLHGGVEHIRSPGAGGDVTAEAAINRYREWVFDLLLLLLLFLCRHKKRVDLLLLHLLRHCLSYNLRHLLLRLSNTNHWAHA